MNKSNEEELIALNIEILRLTATIKNMKARAENSFADSVVSTMQQKDISKMMLMIEKKDKLIEDLKKEIEQLKQMNDRGAGRREKFNDEEKEMIRREKDSGKTVREISEIYNCSVGLVHKLIKN